jgi:photosystem II stability/assembly factor-like uncharacterized protein
MKIIKTFLLLLVFQSILFSQSGWFQQNSGTNNLLRGMFFLNQNTGWIVGSNSTILKTTNSGINWVRQTAGGTSLRKVYFIDDNTGWIVGGGVFPPFGADKVILKTTNAGQNWVTLLYSSGSPFSSIYFIDSMTGWIGSYNGGLFKTTDGGINFISMGFNPVVDGIYFTDMHTGVVGGEPRIYKTINGGDNWTQVFYDSTKNISSMHFINLSLGYAVGHGTILKSTNSGENWISLISFDGYFRHSVFFSSPTHGTIVRYKDFPDYTSFIDRTTNGGINWYQQYSTSSQTELWSTYFINIVTGWVCGEDGLILKTTTGGDPIGINPISTEIPNAYSLSQNYPNPFNPATKIRFDIPNVGSGRDRSVKLVIYDLLGREVAILVNEELKPGVYDVDFDGFNLPSGVYYYRLSSGNYTQTKKMVLLK